LIKNKTLPRQNTSTKKVKTVKKLPVAQEKNRIGDKKELYVNLKITVQKDYEI